MPVQIRPWISEAPIKAAVLQSPGCFPTAAKTYTENWKINIGEMGNEFEEYFLLVFRIIILNVRIVSFLSAVLMLA